VIAPDPEAASLNSDNLDALAGFYKGLASDDERVRFVNALLERLDENRRYLAVSYFMVAVLWRVGPLAPALQQARRDLPAAEDASLSSVTSLCS